MKKFLIMVALLSVSFIIVRAEGNQDIKVSNIIASSFLDNQSYENKAPAREVALDEYASVGLTYSGNTLSVALNAWEYNCALSDFKPSAIVENGVITIKPGAVINGGEWCLCHFDLKFDIENIKPGKYLVRINADLSEEDYRLFEIELDEGLNVTLSEERTCANDSFNENTEWVYCNENETGDVNIFRLTYTNANDDTDKGFIKMTYNDNTTSAETIATVWEYNMCVTRVSPESETLPLILSHFATPNERVEIWNDGDMKYEFDICNDLSVQIGESKFYRDFFSRTMENITINKIEAVEIDGSLRLKITAENGFEWIQGIGAVSPKMPQSIVFPAYAGEFNEIEMTRLMYVRDLRDNHIIYGSPAKDPNWSPAGVANIADREECLNVTADRIIFSGEGAVEIFVYDIDGKKLASVTGNGDTELSTSALLPGVYIAEAVTGKNVVTRKFYK